MTALFPEDLSQRLGATGVVAGFAVEKAEHAVPISKALLEGGISAIELTLRSDAAIEAVAAVCAEVPEMLTGVGTILTPEQVRKVKSVGAHFGVAPGLNTDVVCTAKEVGLPFAPGIATPSELEAAIALGCRLVKFFPAEASGGIPYLRSMSAPYKHLGIQYFPLGGMNSKNMVTYLKEDNVLAIGGTWIVKKDLVDTANWDEIRTRAQVVRSELAALGF